MSEVSKKQLKRLIRRYEFLLEDWEEVDEINKAANQGMAAEIHKHIPPDLSTSDIESDWEDEDEERPEGDAVLKKLFRKIVVKCHPDRMPSDLSEVRTLELIDLYEKAVNAHRDQNWALMVIVAIKLEIDLPEEAEDNVSKIEEEVKDLEEKINNATNSTAWEWYHSEEDQREAIINNYISILQSSKKDAEIRVKNSTIKDALILGVGHPRTGTGYTAKLLQSWGLDVGHEKIGEHGTVDWSLSVGGQSLWQPIDFKNYNWEHVVYCVRDPRKSIPSIVYTEDIGKSSEIFRNQYLENDVTYPIGKAIESILTWDNYITNNLKPDIIFRIEDESEDLFTYLEESGVDVKWSESIIGKKQNTREHKGWKELILEHPKVPALYKNKINEFCMKYGYRTLF